MNAGTLPQAIGGILTDLRRELEASPARGRLSDAEVEAIYARAYREYSVGSYEKALNCFVALLLYRPSSTVYLRGAALCLQRLRRYDFALAAYVALSFFEPDDPAHKLATAECHLLRHEYAAAQEALAETIAYCRETKSHDQVCARAQAMLELMETRNEPAPARTAVAA